MVDGVAHESTLRGVDLAAFARTACRELWSEPLDGLLLLVGRNGQYGMRMFNTDGTEAEMCGNGIRCIARLVRERYLEKDHFTLFSGGKFYPISYEKPLYEGVECYGVEIAIALCSGDFPKGGECFLDRPIPPLDPALRFSFLNLGNPHIVTCVEQIDYAYLCRLGERVKGFDDWFPRGVNVSMVRIDGPNRIFVATYERGVGLTSSCGTAMTAATTVAALLGLVERDVETEVVNRGGMVRCCCRIEAGRIVTRLVGNATFEASGRVSPNGLPSLPVEEQLCHKEIEAYAAFLGTMERSGVANQERER